MTFCSSPPRSTTLLTSSASYTDMMPMYLTPARNRFVSVPGIDMRAVEGESIQSLLYDQCFTPSPSGQNSRRPSLAFSMQSDAPYSGSSPGSSSQPQTPVNAAPVAGQWSESLSCYLPRSTSHHGPTGDSQNPFQEQSLCSSNPAQSFSDYNSMMLHMESRESYNGLPSSGLEQCTNLMPALMYNQTSTPMHVFTGECEVAGTDTSMDGYSTIPASFYHHHSSSTVVPSHTVSYAQLSGLTSPIKDDSSFTTSFGSDLSEAESFGPPDELYFASMQEGRHGYIKAELSSSPVFSDSFSSPLPRRKVTRRRARHHLPHQIYHVGNEFAKIEVVDEAGIPKGKDGRPMYPQHSDSRKIYTCSWVDEWGHQCDGRFERQEHLKRHYGKHSNERKFPCPLPGCKIRIQRGDNACDHFRTHLKGPRPGQRNPHFDYPVLHKRICETFEPKVVDKLLKNIERWIIEREEGASQRKFL